MIDQNNLNILLFFTIDHFLILIINRFDLQTIQPADRDVNRRLH